MEHLRKSDHRVCVSILLLAFSSCCCTDAPLVVDPGGVPEAINVSAPIDLPLVSISNMDNGLFDEEVAYGDRKLLLNGSGLCEWGFLGVDLYHAALYAERRIDDAAWAQDGDQVVVIHLQFARTLTAGQLREAFAASVKTNAGDQFASFEGALGQPF